MVITRKDYFDASARWIHENITSCQKFQSGDFQRRRTLHLTWWFIENVDRNSPDRAFILADLRKKMQESQLD